MAEAYESAFRGSFSPLPCGETHEVRLNRFAGTSASDRRFEPPASQVWEAMKVGKPGGLSAPFRVAGAAYGRRAGRSQAVSGPGPVEAVAATASIMGIPDAEFTPSVRDAIMHLMAEVDGLRHELETTRRRLEEVERTADQDSLLPVLNRRAFVRELTRFIAFAERYGTPASLIYFDLDEFKAINDAHGHAAGDAVLHHFAKVLGENIRDSDVVGRLGGDEFGIILAHATEDQAARKAATLVNALKAASPVWESKTLTIGFTHGTYELRAGENADAAMARADQAMYARKRSAAR